MKFSPCRWWLRFQFHRKLYRSRGVAVTLAASIWLAGAWLAAQGPFPQYGHKAAVDKGPRALGLVQLSTAGNSSQNSPKGNKARLIPIVIMMDGKFFDAGSYKAAPVPMALDFDTVYEGFRSGVSQGIFTITQPGQLNHSWIAEGTWFPAGSKALEKHKKYAPPVLEDEDKGGPPVLHRRVPKAADDSGSESKDKDKDNGSDQQKPAPPSASPASSGNASGSSDAGKAAAPAEPAKAPASSSTAPSASSTPDENITDPNRPRLRRGKADPNAKREAFATFDDLAAAPGASSMVGKSDATAKDSTAASPPAFIFIPAISDAGGPDPRPYTYDVKPAEEAIYRKQMLELADSQLGAQAGAAAKEAGSSVSKNASASKGSAGKSSTSKSGGKSAGKLPTPAFDEVSLRVFDLSNSNEPVLVLSAKAQLPVAGDSGNGAEPQEITLIARTNLEGEVRKLFFSRTDSRHLDMTPRMELIDAVDADGDGRGELLFRRTFDEGSAYAIYRVTADGLWPLFEGTP